MAPTFFAIDHSLSLSTTMKRLSAIWVVQRFVTDPQVKAASPATTTTSCSSAKSRPNAIPSPATRPVPACSRSVAIVFAFRCATEIRSSRPHRPDAIETAGKHFVDVTLVADIENDGLWSSEDAQFDHAEIGPRWPPVCASDLIAPRALSWQAAANLARDRFYIRRSANAVEQARPFLEESDTYLFLHESVIDAAIGVPPRQNLSPTFRMIRV